MQRNPTHHNNIRAPLSVQERLADAVRYARHISIFGASNRADDIDRTNGWVSQQQYRYGHTGKHIKVTRENILQIHHLANTKLDPDTRDAICTVNQWAYSVNDKDPTLHGNARCQPRGYDDPLRDPLFNLTPSHLQVIIGAMQAIIKRQARCAGLAALVSKYLWEHPEGIHRIERMSMESFDHCFLVINREGNSDDPKTWGADAYVVDAWVGEGLIFPGTEFNERLAEIKNFAREQSRYRQQIRQTQQAFPEVAVDAWHVTWEFFPEQDRYPTYHPAMKFEEYYFLQDYRFGKDYFKGYTAARARHALLFNDCMSELRRQLTSQSLRLLPVRR